MIKGTRFSNLFQSVNLFSTAKTDRNPTSLPDHHLKQPNNTPSKSSGRRRKRHYTKKSDIPKYTDTEASSATPSATPSATCSSGESNQHWKPEPDGGAEQDDDEDDLGDFFPPVFPAVSKRRIHCCILVIVVVSVWAVWEHYFRSRSWPSPPWGR